MSLVELYAYHRRGLLLARIVGRASALLDPFRVRSADLFQYVGLSQLPSHLCRFGREDLSRNVRVRCQPSVTPIRVRPLLEQLDVHPIA